MVVACVAILVVGPKDLPAMLRTFGKTVGGLRRMAGDFQRQFNDALKEAEQEAGLDEVKKATSFTALEDARKSAVAFQDSVKNSIRELEDDAAPAEIVAAKSEPAPTETASAKTETAKAADKPASKVPAKPAAKLGAKAGQKTAAPKTATSKTAAKTAVKTAAKTAAAPKTAKSGGAKKPATRAKG